MSKVRVDTISTLDEQHEIPVTTIVTMKNDVEQAKGELQDLEQAFNSAELNNVKKTSNTGAAILPAGTQAQRPGTPANGYIRYNSTTNEFEGYRNGAWGQIGGGEHVLSVKWEASRAMIAGGDVAADGQVVNRATYPEAWAQAQASGLVISDATWLADPTQRGKFSSGNGSTTFRLPDYNGKSAGSLGAVFMRGDGALSAGTAGVIQGDATRNAAGTGAIAVTGCWVIKLFGAVVNVGSANAAQLASDYANLAGRVTTLEGIGKPLTKEYISPEQVITAGGTINLTHGLGAKPKLVEAVLICKTAEQGYSVGEEVSAHNDSTSGSFNFSVGRDSTTIRCICGAAGIAATNTAGNYIGLTTANWRLIVRAWA